MNLADYIEPEDVLDMADTVLQRWIQEDESRDQTIGKAAQAAMDALDALRRLTC